MEFCCHRRAHFAERHENECKGTIFRVISEIFTAMKDSLGGDSQGCVVKMVRTGAVVPRSDRTSSHTPDTFLLAATEGSPKPRNRAPFCWKDLTCPFKYKFGNGDVVDVGQHKND